MATRIKKISLVWATAILAVFLLLSATPAPATAEPSAPPTAVVLAQDAEEETGTLSRAKFWTNVLVGFATGGVVGGAGAAAGSLAADAGMAAAEKAKSKFWDSQIGKFTSAVIDGNSEMLAATMALWMGYHFDPRVGSDAITGVRNIVMMLSVGALVFSLIVGGLRLAARRSTAMDEGLADMGAVLVRMAVTTSLVPILVIGGMTISDSLATEIMNNFGPSDMSSLINLADATGIESALGPIVVLVVMLLSIFGTAMQFLALAVRFLVVPIAAGLLPLFAAASMTGTGKNSLGHLYAYLGAAVIYKPVAALLYVVVFWWNDDLFKSGVVEEDADMGQWLSKLLILIMMGLVGFTAPALIKMLTPAASPTAGSSGSPVGAAAATGAAVATGAVAAVAGAISGGSGAVATMMAGKGAKPGSSGESLGAKTSSSGSHGSSESTGGAAAHPQGGANTTSAQYVSENEQHSQSDQRIDNETRSSHDAGSVSQAQDQSTQGTAAQGNMAQSGQNSGSGAPGTGEGAALHQQNHGENSSGANATGSSQTDQPHGAHTENTSNGSDEAASDKAGSSVQTEVRGSARAEHSASTAPEKSTYGSAARPETAEMPAIMNQEHSGGASSSHGASPIASSSPEPAPGRSRRSASSRAATFVRAGAVGMAKGAGVVSTGSKALGGAASQVSSALTTGGQTLDAQVAHGAPIYYGQVSR